MSTTMIRGLKCSLCDERLEYLGLFREMAVTKHMTKVHKMMLGIWARGFSPRFQH